MTKGLAISEVAERSGVAAATIRMWEQRYGFPEPSRTAAGYRMYSDADVDALRRVASYRRSGLSVPAAVDRARASHAVTDRPSIFGALPAEGRARMLSKRTLIAMSRAIEDETLARAAGPVVLGAFQRERHFRRVEHRYRRLHRAADATVVFADFPQARISDPGAPAEVPIPPDAAIADEWAVVVDAPGFAVCLVGWEPPVRQAPADELDRRFETFWTLDPGEVRQAAHAAAGVAAITAPEVGARIERLLADRPLGLESAVPGLEALTGRIIAYLEAG